MLGMCGNDIIVNLLSLFQLYKIIKLILEPIKSGIYASLTALGNVRALEVA